MGYVPIVQEGSASSRAGVRRPFEPGASWCAAARRRDVVLRSLRVAAVVGTLLVAINHGDRLVSGDIGLAEGIKMCLTYLVPYGVATYAAVEAIRS